MRGDIEEILGPFISMALSIVLALIIGSMTYLYVDLLANIMASQQPALIALQLAGASSAVSAAPQKAVFCYKMYPFEKMGIFWLKPGDGAQSAVMLVVAPGGALEEVYDFQRIHFGPSPIPHVIQDYVILWKDLEKVIGITKDYEEGDVDRTNPKFRVELFDEMEDCEALI